MITPVDLFAFATLPDIQRQPEVAIRRAISAAYYAAFHAIAEAGSELFLGSAELRQRLVRSYEHGAVRTMANEMERHAKQPGVDPDFSNVANSLLLLREARNVADSADYDLSADLTWVDCLDSIILADQLLKSVARLKADTVFAEFLLLPLPRDRKRGG